MKTIENMNWFNEPDNWSISDGRLIMSVTPKSDYWRISHYGFTVDDAPFYYGEFGGEFEAKVGMMGACPDGDGFEATFSNFSVKHLPDAARTKWLSGN